MSSKLTHQHILLLTKYVFFISRKTSSFVDKKNVFWIKMGGGVGWGWIKSKLLNIGAIENQVKYFKHNKSFELLTLLLINRHEAENYTY